MEPSENALMKYTVISEVVLLLTFALPCHAAETLYAGKPLAFWMKRLQSDDVLKREEALAVLADAGSAPQEVKPAVEKLLHSEPLTLRTRAALTWRRLTGDSKPAIAALIDNLKADSVPQRLEAIQLLEGFGEDGAPATPLLLAQLDDRDRRLLVPANQMLIRLGRAAVPGLRDALEGNGAGRRAAAETLAFLGPRGRQAIPALRRCLNDANAEVRIHSARALWVMGQSDEAVATVLEEAFPAREFALGQAILLSLDQAPYRPKTAAAVLIAALRDGNVMNRLLAARLLWETEGQADKVLPVFRAVLSEPALGYQERAAHEASRLGRHAKPLLTSLLDKLQSRGSSRELTAAIAAIGPEAVPPLVELLDGPRANPAQATQAALLLGRLGKPAAEKMLPLLDREDKELRLKVCQILASVGPGAAAAVPRLIQLLADPNARVRQKAASALGGIGVAAVKAAPSLVNTARDADVSVHLASLLALEALHAPAETVRPVAVAALKDENPVIRSRGLRLLRQIDPKHRDLVPQALKLLDTPTTRVEALSLLSDLGADAAAAVPELVKQLEHGEPSRHDQIVDVLGRIGPAAADARPALLKLLEGPQPQLTDVVLRALQAIGPGEPRRILPPLLARMKKDTRRGWQPALLILADLGPAATDAVPWLVERLNRSEAYDRMEAAQALARIDPDCARREATPILRALLHDSMRRIPAAVLLRQLHPDSNEGLAVLIENLLEPNVPTRRMAAEALGQLGPDARGAAPALRRALRDPSLPVRVRIAFALWRVSGETRATLEVLRAMLRDPALPIERGAAASALGRMGAAARDALPALCQASEDPDPFVRRMADEARQKIDGSLKSDANP
jgi:HEAT repeat protein